MNNKNYNSGKLKTGKKSRNRFVSSLLYMDHRKSSIAIIVSVVALALIVCIFFATFYEESLPILIPQITNVSKNPDDIFEDAYAEYPYATITNKTNFVASHGGDDLSDVYLYSEYAILVRLSDMTTIAHQGADVQIYPASMTKVMTVLVAVDLIKDLDDVYTVDKAVVSKMPDGASNAGLATRVGKLISVRDLLYGISYVSAADSVLCLIDYLGLTETQFVELMNLKAKEIGMQNTTFGGAIGMDDEYNQTTCRDVAAMMAYAMENSLCQELFGGLEYRLDYSSQTYKNGTLYDGLKDFNATPETILDGYTVLAVKSGFEVIPGYCLVSYIQNDETEEKFILVTAYAEAYKEPKRMTRIYDMIQLFEIFNP